MRQNYFITGTDTDVGKTVASRGLMQLLIGLGYKVAGFKPVASGAGYHREYPHRVNQDALLLLAQSNLSLAYDMVNPYCFMPATSPHIAAQQSACQIDFNHLSRQLSQVASLADIVVIEGAGGWYTPLSADRFFSDWVKQENLPVILVVGLKLGCINHALLTQQAIMQAGIAFVGWIANHCQPMHDPFSDHYMATLTAHLKAPLIAEIPFLTAPEQADLIAYFKSPFPL